MHRSDITRYLTRIALAQYRTKAIGICRSTTKSFVHPLRWVPSYVSRAPGLASKASGSIPRAIANRVITIKLGFRLPRSIPPT